MCCVAVKALKLPLVDATTGCKAHEGYRLLMPEIARLCRNMLQFHLPHDIPSIPFCTATLQGSLDSFGEVLHCCTTAML